MQQATLQQTTLQQTAMQQTTMQQAAMQQTAMQQTILLGNRDSETMTIEARYLKDFRGKNRLPLKVAKMIPLQQKIGSRLWKKPSFT